MSSRKTGSKNRQLASWRLDALDGVLAKPGQKVYIIKITLKGSKPPIWRRFAVPGEISLDRLHDVIQIVMGWRDDEQHCFDIAGQLYTEAPEDEARDGEEEAELKLCDLVPSANSTLSYEYNLGTWLHTLVVEQIMAVPKDHHACAVCMGGKRSCPPEDVDGIEGYCELLTAGGSRGRLKHKRQRGRSGAKFDPDGFDLDAINRDLAKYSRWSRPRLVNEGLWVQAPYDD